MPTAYHKAVQAALLRIGRKNRSKFQRVWNDRRPLHIDHPWSRKSLLFYPDARYLTRAGKLWLFEVMDSETGSQTQLIAHVIEPLFVPNVLKVVHIVKTAEELRELELVTDVIMSNLTDLAGRKVNSRIAYYRVIVSRSDARSPLKIGRILRDGGIGV